MSADRLFSTRDCKKKIPCHFYSRAQIRGKLIAVNSPKSNVEGLLALRGNCIGHE